jgi:hypothetical protein
MPKSEAKKNRGQVLKSQQQFADHIFDRRKVSILNSLPYSSQEALARLNIYRNNVFGNFSSVLSSIFEVTKKIIGEEKFEELVEKYCVKFSSKSGNLDDYGSEFPQFLKKIKPAFLLDLAMLEWLYHQSYFSADAKNFDVEKFKKISAEKFQNLQFELHPSCFLMESKFAIFLLWKNNVENKKQKIRPAKKSEFIMVERVSGKSMIHKISPAEFIFLSNLNRKKNLYETYKKISRVTKKPCDIGKILSKFIELGVIINFKSERK